MTDTRCELTELLADQCAHCRPKPAKPTFELGYRFTAAWDGECSVCDETFTAGERIGRILGGRGDYACSDCCEDLS